MLYLILIFAILFTGLAWHRPLLAVQLTLFALPAYLLRFKFGIPMTILELMILISFGVWLVRNFGFIKTGLKNRLTKKAGAVEYPFGLEMILVAIAGLSGVAVAGFSAQALGAWKAYFFEPVLLLIVLYQTIGRLDSSLEDKFKKIIMPLACSALLISLLAAYQKITGNLIYNPLWQASATRRVVSVFGYPNAVGLFLETIVIYIFGLLLITIKKSSWQKNNLLSFLPASALATAGLLSLLSIYFAKSNGAALGLLAGFSIFALLYSTRTRLAWFSAVALVLILIFGFGLKRDQAVEYLTLRDFSGQIRQIGWSESWQMLRDGRLITGAGLSNFQSAVTPYHVAGFYFNRDRDPDFHRKLLIFNDQYRAKYWQPLEIYMYPHNIFLNFWSELGLFGLLVFTWLIGKFYYLTNKAFRASQGTARILIITVASAMTTAIIHGLVDVPFFKNDLAVLFWLPIALLGLWKLEQETKSLKEAVKSPKLAK